MYKITCLWSLGLFLLVLSGCSSGDEANKNTLAAKTELKSAIDSLNKNPVAWMKSGMFAGQGESKQAKETDWKKEFEFLNDFYAAPLDNPAYFKHELKDSTEKWIALRSNLTYDSVRITKVGNKRMIEAFSEKDFWLYKSKKNWLLETNPSDNAILGFKLEGEDEILGFHTGNYSFSGDIPSLGQAKSNP